MCLCLHLWQETRLLHLSPSSLATIAQCIILKFPFLHVWNFFFVIFFSHGSDLWVIFINQRQAWIYVSYFKPRTNSMSRRHSCCRRSSMKRRSLATVSSTSKSSLTWSHAPLCTTSSREAAAWTQSRAAAPRCPSLSRGAHGCRQRRRLSGCSGHRIRQRRHHAV
jgi:hypothetical protein